MSTTPMSTTTGMRIRRLALPALAVGATLALVLPSRTDAFTLLGGSLPIDLRDVRLFNNFTNVEANENTVPDPSFPGYTGAELAIWKACVEWGSTPHGDGLGDPTQATLGSGGADFDYSWQGNATVVGGPDDNICSMISGGSSGIYGFTEGGDGPGWRIRFYELRDPVNPWLWQDGPDFEVFDVGDVDMQGCATLFFGFALRLGQSTVSGSTMFAVASTQGTVQWRSIEADDIAGVQAIYGAAPVDKPRITNAYRRAFEVVIEGTDFDPIGNEVWFTRADPATSATPEDGTPVKLTGVPSTAGGTRIVVPLPAEAGPGDVLVRQPVPDRLSNAFPVDLADVGGFCDGDDGALAACPCANPGAPDTGCDVQQGTGGVRLRLVSQETSPQNRVTWAGSGFPAAAQPTSIVIRGSTLEPAPVVFGDGLRCIGVPLVRLAATFAVGSVVRHEHGHRRDGGQRPVPLPALVPQHARDVLHAGGVQPLQRQIPDLVVN